MATKKTKTQEKKVSTPEKEEVKEENNKFDSEVKFKPTDTDDEPITPLKPIEEVVEEINKEVEDPKKEFVKDWKELESVEGHKRNDRGLLYYGVKKK